MVPLAVAFFGDDVHSRLAMVGAMRSAVGTIEGCSRYLGGCEVPLVPTRFFVEVLFARIMMNLSEVLNIPPYINVLSELAERSPTVTGPIRQLPGALAPEVQQKSWRIV